MPRRATLTYTSEDARARGLAPGGSGAAGEDGGGRLRIYYCRATGVAALATDADLAALPTRRTDGASILDTAACALRLYAEEAGTVLLTRRGYAVGSPDTVELQRRLSVGGVPVAYRAAPRPGGGGGGGPGGHPPHPPDLSRFIYILPDALSPCLPGTGGDGGGEEDGAEVTHPPPPVAIKLRGGGCQLAVLLVFDEGGEDGSRAGASEDAAIAGVSPEWVSVRVPARLRSHEAGVRATVAEAVAAALDARRSAVAVQAGPDAGTRIVLVTGVGPPDAFEMLLSRTAAGRVK